MNIQSGRLALPCRAFVASAAVLLLLFAGPALPQTAPPPSLGVQEQGAPPQAAPATPPSQPAPENPGLLDDMGKFFDRILPPLKSPGETLDDLNARAKDAAKGAGDALSRVPKPGSMVSGRMICPVAANGTPDCKQGAERLCQSKGYKEGNSLNTNSAEPCSQKVFTPGRQRKPDDCRTDNYVTTALCQ